MRSWAWSKELSITQISAFLIQLVLIDQLRQSARFFAYWDRLNEDKMSFENF